MRNTRWSGRFVLWKSAALRTSVSLADNSILAYGRQKLDNTQLSVKDEWETQEGCFQEGNQHGSETESLHNSIAIDALQKAVARLPSFRCLRSIKSNENSF